MNDDIPKDLDSVVSFWRSCGKLLISPTGEADTPSPIETIGLLRGQGLSGDVDTQIRNGLQFVERKYRDLLPKKETEAKRDASEREVLDGDRYEHLLNAGFDPRYPGHASHGINTVLDNESLSNLVLVIESITTRLKTDHADFWGEVLRIANEVAQNQKHE